ncbi:MAG TPA: porin family protein [Chitinophaga sp.]|uniref:porin family protein n=1 Tax=Chitinophaga sp. TaxID=1869181 RepID=UPI002C8C74A7|nr:porin family protein [Chitinophaga sp.]HVI47296.1 porin family protein [Chitinophaga sp.]
MKKHLLVLLFPMIGSIATYAQVRLGVKAGFSNAGMKFESNEYVQRKSGWHAGVVADIAVAKNFSLQPQLLFSAKGYRSKELVSPAGVTVLPSVTTKLNYLELPVNFLYKPQVGSGRLFVGAGPYIAMGISGNAKGDKTETVKVKFDGKENENDGKLHAKRIDAGANFLAGYELKSGLFFSVNYSLGMSDVLPGSKSKANYFGISVGYLLPSGKH